jgi:endonuclease/exonuclease/phosphatase family metal-dependent hydrolase
MRKTSFLEGRTVSMNKKSIDGKEILQNIRDGYTAVQIREKYSLTCSQFRIVLNKLSKNNLLTKKQIERIFPSTVRICSYNIRYFNRLFRENDFKKDKQHVKRLEAIGKVLKQIDADLIGIVEAPNTSSRGDDSTITRLEKFAAWSNLNTRKAIMGYEAREQEIAILFNSEKLSVEWKPGPETDGGAPPFNASKESGFEYNLQSFHGESNLNKYTFERPPLEAEVIIKNSQRSFRLMVVHTKAKSSHYADDRLQDRMKIFAQSKWMRTRVNEWLEKGNHCIVMGDFNDAPRMDYYERQLDLSAIELLMGDVFEPDLVLRSCVKRPEVTFSGDCEPSSYYLDSDKKSKGRLFDHILYSQGMGVRSLSSKIWNPHCKATSEDAEIKSIINALDDASDHYPLTIDLCCQVSNTNWPVSKCSPKCPILDFNL